MDNPLPPTSQYTTPPTTTTTPGIFLADATEMIWHKTVIRIYPVTDSTLEELTAGYNSLHLVFFGVCIGAAISLFIAFRTTTALSEKPYYLFSFLACLGLGALFGTFGITNYLRARQSKNRLYEQSIPIEKELKK
jgi:glucan phosphoethanolaminetransferase (alkaline phosphatase superfamily)